MSMRIARAGAVGVNHRDGLNRIDGGEIA